MTSKFHDINGVLLAGADMHNGVFAPTLADMWYMEANVWHPFWMGKNGQKPNVLFNGVPSVVLDHSPKLLWPHFPFAPNSLNIMFWWDALMGTQKCWLPRGSVLICGEPATTTVFWSVSTNVCCWEFGFLWSSLVWQSGTIETTPALGDYLSGITSVVFDLAIDALFYWLFNADEQPTSSVSMDLKSQANFLKKVITDKTIRKRIVNKIGRELESRINPWEWNEKQERFLMKPDFLVNDLLDVPGVIKDGTLPGIFKGDQGDLTDLPIVGDPIEGFEALKEHFWGAGH